MCGIPTSVSATTHERRNLCGGLDFFEKEYYMTTIPTLTYALSEESAVYHLIHLQLPDSADLFELADACTAYVSVLVETDDAVTFATLCERLLAALKRLRESCDSELPSYLVEQLIAGKR